jgi:hypothetical protein
MAIPRHQLVDDSVSGIYHCVSRCVRQAYLLAWEKSSVALDDSGSGAAAHEHGLAGDESEACETTIIVDDHRREWILRRIQHLSEVFAIDCISAAVMSNHMHLLLRTLPEVVQQWSDAEVAYRWLLLHPAQDIKNLRFREPGHKLCEEWESFLLPSREAVAEWRKRMSSLSWYMKELKEPIAKAANREDEVTGAFWEERFKSYRVRDTLGLLACATYIDLNPVAAGMCDSPFALPITSIGLHVDRMHGNGNPCIRDKWKAAASAPITHGYEDVQDASDELEAFINEFDDAEFLPAVPAERRAYGTADSWFNAGHEATISPATRAERAAAEAARKDAKRGRKAKSGKVDAAASAESASSSGDLQDLQPPAKAPRIDVPMITLRAYMRRLTAIARLHADPDAYSGPSPVNRPREGSVVSDAVMRGYQASVVLAMMTDHAEAEMAKLRGQIVGSHPEGSEAYEHAEYGFKKRCQRTREMLERVSNRFGALIR